MLQLTLESCKKALPKRTREAHKGLFGHVLVIGGDYGMGGAVRLAGEAALRSGAGLVSIATRPEYSFVIAAASPALMCHGVFEKQIEEQLLPLVKKATVVILGPGLGQDTWGKALFQYVLTHYSGDLVIDGDGLNILAEHREARDNWILTPHPREASRLLYTLVPDYSTEFVLDNRLNALQALQSAYQGTIVLKGADTLILGKSGKPSEYKGGHAFMATAGMGDVLSGMIGALVAQKMPLEEASQLAVCAHAEAGVLVADNYERGVLASDLFKTIPACLN